MITVNMSERCEKILKLLLSKEEYTALEEIASEMHVSKRSIYYDLYKINEWLEGYEIPELEILRGNGVRIVSADKGRIENLLGADNGSDYIFLPTDRVKIIICHIIQSIAPVYVGQLMEQCHVSRNTIFGDLKVVVNHLNEYGLSLEYASKDILLSHIKTPLEPDPNRIGS